LSNTVSSETPEKLVRVAAIMSGFPSDWFLCGGWAVDAWLGRLTREHGDLDITIFGDAALTLREHLAGWQLIAHDEGADGGGAGDEWTGRPLNLPAHFHCREPELRGPLPEDGVCTTEAGWWLEIGVNPREHGEWVLREEPRVTVPLDHCFAKSPWGVPTALPEILLFFKGTAYEGTRHYLRQRDHVDFERLFPHLTREQRSWLGDAISAVDPDHPWLGIISL
jgi:hypothetical protein